MWRPTSAVEFRITTNNYQARIAEANHRNTQSRQSPFRGKKLKSRCNSADSTFRAKQNLFASTTDEVNVENKEKITKGGKVKSCNLIPKKEPQSKYQFPSWISVGQNVWIFHPSLISFHGWHPGMIKSVINGKSIVVNFFKNNDKLDYGLNHKTLHSIKINQHSIIKYNDGEIISNQETYLRKRSNFIVSIYWNSITQSLERHLEDETLNHLIQSCIIPKTLHSFVTNVCQGNKEILHEIVSFIIEPDHLLFLVPPSVYHEAPIQIIMEPNESIMIRFVLNKSIKAVGIKIFDIEPGTKQFWKSAEIFAIPIQKSKETMKICQIYNIQDSENSQYNLNENKMGIPAVSDNIITNFYQQLLCHKYAFHEHQDSDTSLGFLFKNSIVLHRNTLYCIRIRLNAASKNNVFVNKSFVHIFKERPLYNYRYALFRSLQFCLPATMNFVPNIAVMAKTCL